MERLWMMDDTVTRISWQRSALYVLCALLLVRVILMAWLPLTDTTEARYAEIARKMLETGNWVTPLHDYSVPFWAKPPLSTWLSALSMGLLGQNEFAVRLPSLLLALGTLWLTAGFARSQMSRESSDAAALMLAASPLFFAAAGAVMTDPALLFCTTLIQVAFWRALVQGKAIWGYAFFIGIGLGLLAKGPIALVLTGLPIFFWVLLRRQWLWLWHAIPWIRGSLLALLIAAPWYIWAELRTPGFLHYFIVGEHIQRFLDPGWQGDRYGFAHSTAHGLIWLYALGALLPWSLAAPVWLLRRDRWRMALTADGGWTLYLALWTCMPLLFFSFSGNIIFPYALPMLPGACLLLATLWGRDRVAGAPTRLPFLAASSVLIGLLLVVLQMTMSDRLLRTQKQVIQQWQALQPTADSQLVYWNTRREFSAEFYSAGRARTTHDSQQLQSLLAKPTRDFVVIDSSDMPQLPVDLQLRLMQMAEVQVKGASVLILAERSTATASADLDGGNR